MSSKVPCFFQPYKGDSSKLKFSNLIKQGWRNHKSSLKSINFGKVREVGRSTGSVHMDEGVGGDWWFVQAARELLTNITWATRCHMMAGGRTGSLLDGKHWPPLSPDNARCIAMKWCFKRTDGMDSCLGRGLAQLTVLLYGTNNHWITLFSPYISNEMTRFILMVACELFVTCCLQRRRGSPFDRFCPHDC